MKLSVTVALLFSTSLILAQGLPDVPSCSLQCFLTSLSNDGCSALTDFACHCAQPGLVTEVTPCVEEACNERDQSSVSSAVVSECSAVGVPISIPPVGGSSSQTTATITSNDPTQTGENETTAPVDGPVSPSGPVMTLPTSTDTTPPNSATTPHSSSAHHHPSSAILTSGQPEPTGLSPPFVGGAMSFNAAGKLAGAAAAIAAGILV